MGKSEEIEKTPHQKIEESLKSPMERLTVITSGEIKDFADHAIHFAKDEEDYHNLEDQFVKKILSEKFLKKDFGELPVGKKQEVIEDIAQDLSKSYEEIAKKEEKYQTNKEIQPEDTEKQRSLKRSLGVLNKLEEELFIRVPEEKE